MNNSLFSHLLLPATLGALLASGCSSDSGSAGGASAGGAVIASGDVQVAEQFTLEVTEADSEELAGTKLIIPAGALEGTLRITVKRHADVVADGALVAGPAVEFGPAGTVFSKPVRLELPYIAPQGAAARRIFVQVLEANGERMQLPATVEGDVVVTTIHGFTSFQPAGAGDENTEGEGENGGDGDGEQAAEGEDEGDDDDDDDDEGDDDDDDDEGDDDDDDEGDDDDDEGDDDDDDEGDDDDDDEGDDDDDDEGDDDDDDDDDEGDDDDDDDDDD
jgi:hypothetical protein